MIKHFLFDLDGTLLPLDEDQFINVYMKTIGQKFGELGLNAKEMVEKLWQGTHAMILNDGRRSNEDVFWDVFYPNTSNQDALKNALTHFYQREFQKVKASTSPNVYAQKIIEHLKKSNRNIYLLTNPIFPKIATDQRIQWAGLKSTDFNHITTYENAYYAKPNLKYYQYILERFNLDPTETMMVGNDVSEDMIAKELGMSVYLVTDCLKNEKALDISDFKQGTLKEFYQYLLEQY